MSEQTKLDTYQKAELKDMKDAFLDSGGKIFHFPNNGVCVVMSPYNPDCNTRKVSWSMKSPDETKYRKKVAEYMALWRYSEGVSLPVSSQNIAKYFSSNEEYFATYLADTIQAVEF